MTAKECGRISAEANVKQLILSHLLQNSDLSKLISQAKSEAPDTEVNSAQKNMKITI